jgi:hypothetical protein
MSRDGSVSELDVQDSISGRGKDFTFSRPRIRIDSARKKSGRSENLAIQLHLVPRLNMRRTTCLQSYTVLPLTFTDNVLLRPPRQWTEPLYL